MHISALLNVESTMLDFWRLLKPKIIYLVVFTAVAEMVAAPGSAGAINMWYDRDIDLLMKGTQDRPIPSGRVSAESALEFGVILGVLSVFIMVI
ncbi:hypothetical protein X798_02497 [Onchocerca flexuosa]|uniref:Protoheme IX farnesyltransferase n=1 Tax=Onchocerca flexuosa TaxID=387005 RepID=A0A238BZ04_9BILA|nr:hypothetical protein X798_02497 [Onchocerca flexuosa]